MRGVASYIFAGVVVVLGLDMLAPPVFGLPAVSQWPSFSQSAPEGLVIRQTVNRSAKSDRLPTAITVKEPAAAPSRPKVMVGCDPAFSPLSTQARANFAARCVA